MEALALGWHLLGKSTQKQKALIPLALHIVKAQEREEQKGEGSHEERERRESQKSREETSLLQASGRAKPAITTGLAIFTSRLENKYLALPSFLLPSWVDTGIPGPAVLCIPCAEVT